MLYGIREPHQSMAKKKEITQEDVEIMWKKRQDELECRRDQQRERREKQREANKMVERRALADVVTKFSALGPHVICNGCKQSLENGG